MSATQSSSLGSHEPPRIRPRISAQQPRFSVVIPTFEPDGKLCVALSSVLQQLPRGCDMQICVVDDCSSPGLVRHLVELVDHERRVELIENTVRLGLSGNWNRSIQCARGELIHLLHQDDYVLQGFYQRMDHGLRRCPSAGMAFCRSRIVNGAGRTLKRSSRLRWFPGVLDGWLTKIAERQRIQTPAAVVPRSTYERIGGYRLDLVQAVDWEMWVRIATAFPVWYEPRALAAYRRHPNNESSRLLLSGQVWPDMVRAIHINASSLPPALRRKVLAASGRWCAASALRTVERQLAAGALAAAASTLEQVPELLEFTPDVGGRDSIGRRFQSLRNQVGHRLNRAA